MHLYLAGAEVAYHNLHDIPGVRFLLSYHYICQPHGAKALDFTLEHGIPLFLDSGAFSAYMSGATISNREYIDFCLEHQDRFEVIASLDVIGDHRGTKKNHDEMKAAGVRSIPTFHVAEPFEALEALAAENDYVALGVAGKQRRRKALMAWLTRCFKIIHTANPKCEVHGFALTSTRIMRYYPWKSVDSTTWLNGRKYGTILLNEFGQIKHVPKWRAPEIIPRVRRVRHLLDGETGGFEWYTKIDKFNAREMTEWAQSLTAQKSRK